MDEDRDFGIHLSDIKDGSDKTASISDLEKPLKAHKPKTEISEDNE